MESDMSPSDKESTLDRSRAENTINLQESYLSSRLPFGPGDKVDVGVHNVSVSMDLEPQKWTVYAARAWAAVQCIHYKNSVKKKRRTNVLLDNVCVYMPGGSLTVIIGSSGAGKTTLLDVVGGGLPLRGRKIQGSVTFNGQPMTDRISRAYVRQEDFLIPSLTVRETLQYSADLRLPPPTTAQERREIVEQVIDELGLRGCANTMIGKGCSGGEKRRTSIGIQMLANSSILLCDEPTTGLDATSALRIISGLKRLGQSGRTVIISLHSPRSEIWDLVDNILLLSRGSVIFTGKAQDVLPYFKSQGYIPDPFTNPMEFLIDLVSLGSRTPELERCSRQRVENLKNVWKSRGNRGKNQSEMATRNATATRSMPTPTRSSPVPFSQQTYVLTARTFRTTIRDPMGVCASFIRAIGTAILNGWIFYNLDESLAGIRSRQGSLYVASNINGYIILICEVFRLSVEMKVFDRERKDGSIGVTAFLLSQRTSRLFLEDLPMTLIYSAIFYFMVGFDPNARQFFIFFAFSFMTHYAAVAFAAVCIGIARNFGIASLISSGSFFFQSFTCGFLIQTDQIPVYVRWLKWISYMFYVFSGLCTNEFAGHFYACPYSTDPMDPACQQFTGHAILDNLGFPPDWTGRPIAILVAFVACFYIVAGLLLHYNQSALGFTWKRRTSKKTNPEGFSTTPLSNNAYAMQRNQQVVISLDNYALNIKKWAWPSLAPQTVQILRPLTTEFQPGQLNVIIGPSGSGKTSLLSLMARSKAHTSPTTQYQQSGTMLYNRAIPSPSTIRSATSFVRQENDSLIPTLTVRETLQFSAQLRLPSWLSLQEKLHRSEHVLLQMSLMDCANNTIKRISGGEKRRLTIAVQLLTNPSILLLDEPTSGLDVFTAQSIIHHLHQLSNNGMTIIMSIHQARASMLNQFSHVVLLASGGYQVYAGEGKDMVTHFRSWGYNCPETTNPADFVLDLISNDQASETAHFISHRQLESQNLRRETSHITQQITAPAQLGNLQREVSSFRVAFPVVLSRSFLTITRQPWVILVRGLQVVGIAAAVTLFYAPLQHNYEAVQSRMGFVQEFAALYFVGLLQNLAIYPYERDIFYLEEAEFCYSAETFLAQYTLLEIPFEIFTSIIFGVLAAYGCGLKRTPQMFSICAFDSFCILNCGESIGIIFATIFSHTAFAVHVVSVLLSASAVLSGIMSLNVNSFLSALNYLSPVKYLVANLAPYSMRNQVFTCTSSQTLPNGQCSIENGTQVLQLYNLDQGAAMNLMALGICTIVYRLVAYIFLRFRLRYVMEKLHDLMTWLSFFHKSRSILSQSDNN